MVAAEGNSERMVVPLGEVTIYCGASRRAAVAQKQRPTEPWWAISLVAGGGVILCWMLIIMIGIFSRPRFLVLPYLRAKRRL
ncbi:hypothetical protein [Streptomyces collinus]|uniref:hypothetical protein n=1 Tax=Streptomyces collinus TaxID=42684 RepID=UPI002942B867|nr:hypothetical protein [Streptomyces collinus]